MPGALNLKTNAVRHPLDIEVPAPMGRLTQGLPAWLRETTCATQPGKVEFVHGAHAIPDVSDDSGEDPPVGVAPNARHLDSQIFHTHQPLLNRQHQQVRRLPRGSCPQCRLHRSHRGTGARDAVRRRVVVAPPSALMQDDAGWTPLAGGLRDPDVDGGLLETGQPGRLECSDPTQPGRRTDVEQGRAPRGITNEWAVVEHYTTVRQVPPTLGGDMSASASPGHPGLSETRQGHDTVDGLGELADVSKAARLMVHGSMVRPRVDPAQPAGGGCGQRELSARPVDNGIQRFTSGRLAVRGTNLPDARNHAWPTSGTLAAWGTNLPDASRKGLGVSPCRRATFAAAWSPRNRSRSGCRPCRGCPQGVHSQRPLSPPTNQARPIHPPQPQPQPQPLSPSQLLSHRPHSVQASPRGRRAACRPPPRHNPCGAASG